MRYEASFRVLPLVICADTVLACEIVGSIKTDIKYPSDPLTKAFEASPREPNAESPLSQEERRDFITFVRSMLQVSPQARKAAHELLQESWLHKEYEYPEYESH